MRGTENAKNEHNMISVLVNNTIDSGDRHLP